MARPLPPTELLAALHGAGIRPYESADWRRRPTMTPHAMGPMHGVLLGHTATSQRTRALPYVRDGLPGRPGPWCHMLVTREGALTMVATGLIWHAGLGDPEIIKVLQAGDFVDRYPGPLIDTEPGDGYFYGMLLENDGLGEPYTGVQIETAARAAAVLCVAHSWSHGNVLGQFEWSTHGLGPHGLAVHDLRTRVAVHIQNIHAIQRRRAVQPR